MNKTWEESVNATISKTNDLLVATELLLGKGGGRQREATAEPPATTAAPLTPPTARPAHVVDESRSLKPPTPARLTHSLLDTRQTTTTSAMMKAGGPGGSTRISFNDSFTPIPGFSEPLPGTVPLPPPPRLSESVSQILDLQCKVFNNGSLLPNTYQIRLPQRFLDTVNEARFNIHNHLARNGVLIETSPIPLQLYYWNHANCRWTEIGSCPYMSFKAEPVYMLLFASGVAVGDDVNKCIAEVQGSGEEQDGDDCDEDSDSSEGDCELQHIKLVSMASAVHSRNRYIIEMEAYLRNCSVPIPKEVKPLRKRVRNDDLLQSALCVLQEEKLRTSPKATTVFLRVAPGKFEERSISVDCEDLKYHFKVVNAYDDASNCSIPFLKINRFSPYSEANVASMRLGLSISVVTDDDELIFVLPSSSDVSHWVSWVSLTFEGRISVAP